jgi:hypothetical protein
MRQIRTSGSMSGVWKRMRAGYYNEARKLFIELVQTVGLRIPRTSKGIRLGIFIGRLWTKVLLFGGIPGQRKDPATQRDIDEHPGQKQNHNYFAEVLESNSSWATVSVVADHHPRKKCESEAHHQRTY